MLIAPFFLMFIDLVFPLLQIVVCPLKFVFPRGAFPVADLYNLHHCENHFLQWRFWGSCGRLFLLLPAVRYFCDISFRYCGLCRYFCIYRPWQGNVCSGKGQFLCLFAQLATLRKSFSSMTILGKLRQAVFTVPALRFFDTVWQRVVA